MDTGKIQPGQSIQAYRPLIPTAHEQEQALPADTMGPAATPDPLLKKVGVMAALNLTTTGTSW